MKCVCGEEATEFVNEIGARVDKGLCLACLERKVKRPFDSGSSVGPWGFAKLRRGGYRRLETQHERGG